MSHTPGPWNWIRMGSDYSALCAVDVVPMEQGLYQFVPLDKQIIDDGSTGGEYGGVDPKSANMVLIAAAPDLLEALENLLDQFPDCECENCQQGRAAVKKANGETECQI